MAENFASICWFSSVRTAFKSEEVAHAASENTTTGNMKNEKRFNIFSRYRTLLFQKKL